MGAVGRARMVVGRVLVALIIGFFAVSLWSDGQPRSPDSVHSIAFSANGRHFLSLVGAAVVYGVLGLTVSAALIWAILSEIEHRRKLRSAG